MKKLFFSKILYIMLAFSFVMIIMSTKSNASNLSISTSKSSVSPGESFTVTVSVNGGAGSVTTSVSNGSGGKTDFLDNGSYSFTCTAGNSGSVTINASGVIGDYETEQDQSKSASKTVTIVQPSSNSGGSSSAGNSTTKPSTNTQTKPTTPTVVEEKPKSKDSSLSALSISEVEFTPEFNKDVREYSLNIPYEMTEINVDVTVNDSKAKAVVTGNTDLKEGENTVTITVTAEDGSSSNYLIRVIRARVPLALKSLAVKYINQEGEIVEIPLNPSFNSNTLGYNLEDLEYWVENLLIEAIANIEGTEIDIQGAENLNVGENTITITAKVQGMAEGLPEGEEPKEETITYVIKVNKKQEPTVIAKIQNWFKGIFGGVSSWYNNNAEQIVLYSLALCVVALFGLSIYIILDYNKYKDVVAKLKKVNEINNAEIAVNEAENLKTINNVNNKENIEKSEEKNKEDKPKGGRHF